jgi:aldose sugar dehydrogenase
MGQTARDMIFRTRDMIFSTYGTIADLVSRHRRIAILSAVLGIALYSLMLIVAGIIAQKRAYPAALRAGLQGLTTRKDPNHQTVNWTDRVTNIHTLQVARIHIGNGLGFGGGLVEVAGNLIFASSKGRFGYMDGGNHIRPLDFVVPMNLQALRQSPHYEDPLFAYTTIRVAGLLAIQVDATHVKLYVSHHYFQPKCIQFRISSINLEADQQGVRASSPDWETVFIARPNCFPDKDRSWRFVGEQAGGRLVRLDANTLLVSVGDHQFDGFNDAWAAPMDPATDLGKIIKIDLRTRKSSILASGVRNPQGLTIARDGRIWETEHGPQGGDEVNLIREGANYGWPIVTYGMNYGYPRRYWPLAPVPAAHDGYSKPAFAFVPSIGISNIVEPSISEFPDWRSSLIVASLRAHTLFLLRTEDKRGVYAEPISADEDRVRDIVSRANGQLAYLSDEGYLVLIRNAEQHKGAPTSFAVEGFASLSKPFPEELPPAESSPIERGRLMYSKVCAHCHTLDGTVGAGPPLNGVVGRRVGSFPGYSYSDPLARYDGVWTRDMLISFVTDPDKTFHGTTMPIAPISWTEVPNIINYLQTTRSGGPR